MSHSSRLTEEQLRVINTSAFRTRVVAGAGTGKTSTLVHYARVRPRERGLYLAFNRSVKAEAQRRFPANCHTSTFHAIAYASHGRPYQAAGKLVASIAPASVLHLVKDKDSTRRFLRVRMALRAVHEFTVSTALSISPSDQLLAEARDLSISGERLVEDARLIWHAMRDVDDRTVGISHDGYFKLFALDAKTDFARPFNYVLVDEAQDLNPVADQLLQAASCDVCYVGDTAQSIYAFRGARDCLEAMTADVTLQLTQSFRFGSNIADLANRLLLKYMTTPLVLTGMNPTDMVGSVQDDLPFGVICRTNAGAFKEAVAAVSEGKAIHFVGGAASYSFSRIRQAYNLSAGNLNAVKDPFLRALGSFELLKDYADLVQDSELRSICRVVEQYGSQIPGQLERIEASTVVTPQAATGPIESVYPAQVFLTTCHKAKGLEFQQVRLSDDFPSLMKDGRALSKQDVDPQEVNLLYVALTRAAFVVEPPAWLTAVLGVPGKAEAPRPAPRPPVPPVRVSPRPATPTLPLLPDVRPLSPLRSLHDF